MQSPKADLRKTFRFFAQREQAVCSVWAQVQRGKKTVFCQTNKFLLYGDEKFQKDIDKNHIDGHFGKILIYVLVLRKGNLVSINRFSN